MSIRYAEDYAGWAAEQARLLRGGHLQQLDIDHLAEELESIMGNERREIYRRFRVLIAHLLKWQFQPEGRGNSWRSTIRVQRADIAKVLKHSPSLRRENPEQIDSAYSEARELAADETGKLESDFPLTCPYSEAEILDKDFWPES